MRENKKQKTIEALYIVVEEFESKPMSDHRTNEITLEILSERIETITSGLDKLGSIITQDILA